MKKINLRYIAGILLLLIIAACTFQEPTLPTWFTDWALPIPNPGFVMSEVINDSTIIDTTYQGNKILAVSIKDTSERKQISPEDLAFEPESDTTTKDIGDIDLNSPGTEQSQDIPVEQLLGMVLEPGTTVDIPETAVNLPPQFIDFQSFEFIIDVKTGTLQMEFFNNTFLTFRENMQVNIYDSISADFVGLAVFPESIGPGETALSQPVDLAERHFSNHLQFELEATIAAMQDHFLTPDDVNGYVYYRVTISEMTVGYALAEIPEQNVTQHDSASMEDREDKIITAKVDFGEFKLVVENTMNVEADVTVELLNFYYDQDYTQVYSRSYLLPPVSIDSFTVALDDLYLTDYNDGPTPGSFMEYMKYDIHIITIPSEGMVEMSEHDSVVVSIKPIDSVYVAEFYGYLAGRTVDFEPEEQKNILESEGFTGSILFEEMIMDINVYNQMEIGVSVDLQLVGYNIDYSDSIVLKFDDNPIQVNATPPGKEIDTTRVTLDIDNSNIVQFIEFLPSHLITSGSALVEGVGKVNLGDEVWADYHLFSPFFVKLQNDPKYTSKINFHEVPEDLKEGIRNEDITVPETFADLKLFNSLPVGAQLTLYVSADSNDIFDTEIKDSTKKVIKDNIFLEPGKDTNNDGFVDEAFLDDQRIDLTLTELKVFTNDSVYVASRLKLDETDELVKFRQTDEVKALGAFHLRYRINNNNK